MTQFLTQLVTHTPLYVWAILAFLVYRGMAALRDRDVEPGKLCIIPLVMLALSLQDIAAKFSLAGLAPLAWAIAAGATMLLAWRFGGTRVAAGSSPGSVRVRGSWVPLAMMMAVFFTKYAASVALAIRPQAAQDALFTVVVCALFGLFNGYFLGRLARDLKDAQALRAIAAVTPA